MDPRNGELLALANWPRSTPTTPAPRPPTRARTAPSASTYEPGSTFKAFTVAGALEDGVVTPDTDVRPRRRRSRSPTATIGESHAARLRDAHAPPQILAQSSNVGAITIGLRAGRAALRPVGAALRLRQADRRRPARRGARASCCRSTSTRAPRWATCRSARASRSRRCRWRPPTPRSPTAASCARRTSSPRSAASAPPTPQGQRVISRGDRRASCARCSRACSRPGGTASEVSIPGYKLAGKTGTAKKLDPTTGEYSKTTYVASFVGFAPAPRPEAARRRDGRRAAGRRSTAARSPRPAFEQIMSLRAAVPADPAAVSARAPPARAVD